MRDTGFVIRIQSYRARYLEVAPFNNIAGIGFIAIAIRSPGENLPRG